MSPLIPRRGRPPPQTHFGQSLLPSRVIDRLQVLTAEQVQDILKVLDLREEVAVRLAILSGLISSLRKSKPIGHSTRR